MALDEVLVTVAVLWDKQWFRAFKGASNRNEFCYFPQPASRMEKRHMVACGCSIVSLPTWVHGPTQALRAPPPRPPRPRPPPTTTPVASREWRAARIQQTFTNYLTRGSICLQDQYATIDLCEVSWALDVSDPPPAISRPRILCLSRHRISLRCASISRNNHRW